MMGPYNAQHIGRLMRQWCEHALTERWMLRDLAKFVGSQQTGFMQYSLPGSDFPNVMKLTAQSDAIEAWAVKSEAGCGCHSVLADPDRMAAGIGILCLERSRQHLDALEKQLLDSLRLLLNLPLEVLLIKPIL